MKTLPIKLLIALVIVLSAEAVEKFKQVGAVSCAGSVWGAQLTPQERNLTVQYWLNIQIWENRGSDTNRSVMPGDVVITSAEKPIVIETNGQWVIRFDGPKTLMTPRRQSWISAPGWLEK